MAACLAAAARADDSPYFPGAPEPVTEEFPVGSGVLPPRFALVIGINSYDRLDPRYKDITAKDKTLNNPATDAKLVADQISMVGFVTTRVTAVAAGCPADAAKAPYATRCLDRVTRNDILHEIEAVAAKANEAYQETHRRPILLFYFAGHGVSYQGVNYILPSDSTPTTPEDIAAMNISVEEIANRLDHYAPALRILIFDACRNAIDGHLVEHPDVAANFSFIAKDARSSAAACKDGRGAPGLYFKNKNNLVVMESTVNGSPAADNNVFTNALAEGLRAFIEQGKRADGVVNSTYLSLKEKMTPILLPDQGGSQKFNVYDESSFALNFILTRRHHDDERFLFTKREPEALNIVVNGGAKKPADQGAADAMTVERYRKLRFRAWCKLAKIEETYTHYGYFTPAVDQLLQTLDGAAEFAGRISECETIDDEIASNVPERASIVKTDDGWRKVGSPGAGGADGGPTLTSIADPETVRALGKLDLTQPLNNLAVGVLPAGFAGPPPCQLAAGQLLQVLDVLPRASPANPPPIRVRTSEGCELVVGSESVIPGRFAVSFTTRYPGVQTAGADATAVSIDQLKVAIPADFPSWLVVDGEILYDAGDPNAIFKTAWVDEAVKEKVRQVSPALADTLVLHHRKVQTAELAKQGLTKGGVKVALVIIPVTDTARAFLIGRDYGAITAADAVDITTLIPNPRVEVSASLGEVRAGAAPIFKAAAARERDAGVAATPFPPGGTSSVPSDGAPRFCWAGGLACTTMDLSAGFASSGKWADVAGAFDVLHQKVPPLIADAKPQAPNPLTQAGPLIPASEPSAGGPFDAPKSAAAGAPTLVVADRATDAMGPDEACLASAADQVQRSGDAEKQFGRVFAFVQAPDADGQGAYNTIAPALRKAGFLVPAWEKVGQDKSPETPEVRFCPAHSNGKAADLVALVLNGCKLGQFKVTKISKCPAKPAAPNVEVWFPRQPKTSRSP